MPITVQHNPFATRFTRPGALPFLFNNGNRLESIVDAFHDCGFVCQIVGQHGSGKTTLTYALEPILRDNFHPIRRFTVRGPRQFESSETLTPTRSPTRIPLLVIDGFEKLPWLHRRLLVKHVRDQRTGLLITTHQPIGGIPVLLQMLPTLETLQRLTCELAPDLVIQKNLLAAIFDNNHGNIRESLMTLYNWFETQKTIT